MPSDAPVIEVQDLHKSLGGRPVLKGVSLQVRKGETVVILGGSGCGKSTLLRHLLASYKPDRGKVLIFGQDLQSLTRDSLDALRLRLGIVFQSGALYNSMTVANNVALPMREHTHLDDNIMSIMVKMKLELVGLRGFDDLMPAQLSGGMRKRVALARAIALDPEMLLYDEPTAGLDPIMSSVIDQLIMDLAKKLGVTSVVVTHDLTSAFKVGDRIIMLYEGAVIESGTAGEIQNSTNPVVRQFITGAPDGPIPLRRSSMDFATDLMGEI